MAASISKISTAEEIETILAPPRRRVDDALRKLCDGPLLGDLDLLAPVVRYSVLSGGKRFRGLLVCGAYSAVTSDDSDAVYELAAAVEIVHAYSLIHDDLPCMDDDDTRRGMPSAHRKFSVQLATAAGVAMVPLAVRVVSRAAQSLGLEKAEAASIAATLMRAAGGGGMIAGQLLDLEGEGRSLPLADVERLHAAKTGALIAASAEIGALAARGAVPVCRALRHYGTLLGLAFQIADDLLDVTSSTAALGKTAGRDALLGKSTYPALLGVDEARRMAEAKANEAIETVREAGLYSPVLGALATYVVSRNS